METLTAETQQHMTVAEQQKLYDRITENHLWDLRTTDAYFDSYERIETRRPDMDKAELDAHLLWNLAAEYADQSLTMDDTEKAAFVMFAMAPRYAMVQSERDHVKKDPKQVPLLSQFNDRIRDFVDLHRETDREVLAEQLTAFVASTHVDLAYKTDAELRKAFEENETGVRGEVGFEQLLDASNTRYSRGNTAEDTVGIDYRVPIKTRVLRIDVKNSITGSGVKEELYRSVGDGKFKLLVPLRDSDFVGNTFEVRPESLEDKAPGMRAILEHMANTLR